MLKLYLESLHSGLYNERLSKPGSGCQVFDLVCMCVPEALGLLLSCSWPRRINLFGDILISVGGGVGYPVSQFGMSREPYIPFGVGMLDKRVEDPDA